MNARGHSLLVVDDDREAVQLLREVFERDGLTVRSATSAAEGLRILSSDGPFDAVLTDLRMPGASGLDLLRAVREHAPGTIVLMLTAFGDATAAGEAIRAGAHDFISKPYDVGELRRTVSQALERRDQVTRAAAEPQPDREVETPASERELVGHSPGIIAVMKTVARVAASRASVLVVGETGTGKELVARTIHAFSDRASKRFVGVNCAALAEGVLESELFGHVRGAFTGAVGARAGVIREADGGTLFLDEIGDISPGTQTRLLRVLQEQEVVPVGSETPVRVDVRVVAATHQDLPALVKSGGFREDLYYRLNVVTIALPALRERRQDIPLLFDRFLRRLAARHGRGPVAVDPGAAELLVRYDWPGNVRELQNVLERAVVLAEQDVIGPEHLPPELRAHESTSISPTTLGAQVPLAEVEREHVLGVLASVQGSRERAAAILGISRRTLSRMLQRWGHLPD